MRKQVTRFDAQAELRERNGKHLAERLAQIPGIRPQSRGADRTRHGYHSFLWRLDAEEFGVPRNVLLKALAAEANSHVMKLEGR
jgi:hypothetical protein